MGSGAKMIFQGKDYDRVFCRYWKPPRRTVWIDSHTGKFQVCCWLRTG